LLFALPLHHAVAWRRLVVARFFAVAIPVVFALLSLVLFLRGELVFYEKQRKQRKQRSKGVKLVL